MAARLRELEADGVIFRVASSGQNRFVQYQLTPRGEQLAPAFDASALTGVAERQEPRDGEVVTTASLVSALRVAAHQGTPPKTRCDVTFTIQVTDVVVHTVISQGNVSVGPGAHPDADPKIIAGTEFRALMSLEADANTAVPDSITFEGDRSLLSTPLQSFHIPQTEPSATDQP